MAAPLVVFGKHASEAARDAAPWRNMPPAVYDVAFADNATVVSGGIAIFFCCCSRATEVECRIQPGLLFSQIASQGNLHDMFCSCLDISPDGRCLALGRNDGRALTWALETPRAAYARLLLLRAATKEGAKPRVTATDAASTGHLVLFRLVDEGKADVAAYALKFIL